MPITCVRTFHTVILALHFIVHSFHTFVQTIGTFLQIFIRAWTFHTNAHTVDTLVGIFHTFVQNRYTLGQVMHSYSWTVDLEHASAECGAQGGDLEMKPAGFIRRYGCSVPVADLAAFSQLFAL